MVGVNGAGKSTLARVLAGVEPFQAGERDIGVNTVIGYFVTPGGGTQPRQ